MKETADAILGNRLPFGGIAIRTACGREAHAPYERAGQGIPREWVQYAAHEHR